MHWYVVASQKEVRIFVKTLKRQQLKIFKTLTNLLGGEKRRALIRKQAGQGVKSIGHIGSIHYSVPKRHDPHEDAVIQFAREITQFLEKEKLKKSFESLSIIAEPHLLGKIRTEMSDDLKTSVTHWIKKDLQKTPKNKLVGILLPKESQKTASAW
ncbi:MAG: hypothetical protein A2622_04295 [Bdellovibrionales bacterium RIFCSPHIGHO2_01_FULL_40_29]|nr:MAG: hypothetical protein A2622_04295 [Bdellovibrionales bacterium RIFCSPHIGHO2_01_FULL_40_29]OFZ34841.1 MAG: hypothetical protein A3D17_11080 [Bdellovibrionales bacterium RIFCSPHIGHO2_02_FULL_40_15]